MSVTLKIPPALREFCGGASEVEIQGNTIGEAIRELDRIHSGMGNRICTEQGQPRKHVLIYVNEEDIRQLQGMLTPLKNGDVVHILPAVSGG